MDPIDLDDITSDIYAGPFHDVQRQAGASFYEDYGHLWTKSFGDPVAEYWAVRREAGLWDVSALVKFHFTGRDVLPALDRLTTRAMLGVEPGTVRYGMVLNHAGVMLDEGTSLVLSAQEAYFLGNDDSGEFLAHLVEHTAELVGSCQSPSRQPASAGSWFVRVSRREKGYEFYLLDGRAEALWKTVVRAGATPIGLDAIEMLRVEAGLIIGDEDYWPGKTDPYDLSLDRFIDLEGLDFVGRDRCVETAAAPRADS